MNTQKILLLSLSSILFSTVYGQNAIPDTSGLIQQLCTIIQRDQSNIDDRLIRKTQIIENFNALISITEKYGFPNETLSTNQADRIYIHSATSMTILHISQMTPDLMLNENFIQLIHKQLMLKRIEPTFLEDALSFWYNGSTKPCIEYKDRIEYMLSTWGLKVLDTKQYQTCN